MDGEESAQQNDNNSTLSQEPTKKRRGRKKKTIYQTVSTQNKFKVEEKWNVTEKMKLLEALKRFEPHNISSIAALVGTKTEEQVEQKITAYRGPDLIIGKSPFVKAVPKQEKKAPLETWTDLLQEMTCFELADYAVFIPKVLGLITRNEKFADSGYPELDWKNIYQFLTDITDDKLEVHKLTDMESLVILDMMHSIGDTLLNSDTSEHRRILDYKNSLLSFKPDFKNKERNLQRIAEALSNDLWNLDCAQGTSSNKPSSSSAMDCDELTLHGEQVLNIGNMTETNGHSSSASEVMNAVSSSQSLTAGAQNPSSNSTNAVQQDIRKLSNEENSINNRPTEINGGETSSEVESLSSNQPDKKFVHPKFFTLNPLCIPTQLLPFKPKKVTDQNLVQSN